MPKIKSKKKSPRVLQETRKSSNKLQFPPHFVIIAFALLVSLFLAANIQTTQNLTASAKLSVLGDDEDRDEDKQEENKEDENEKEEEQDNTRGSSGSLKSGSSNIFRTQSASPKPTSSSLTNSVISPTGVEDDDIDDDDEDEDEQETELVTADGQKIKTKVKNGVTTEIEIRRGELKLKYKFEDGKLVLKVENETGEEVELEDDELEELEDEAENELEEEDLAIQSVEGNALAVTKNQVAAITDFPLSIDVGTNQLILSTPEGPRVVTVLPDQAVQNLLATGIINRVETPNTDTATQLGAFTGVVKLEIRNNDIVYKVNGVKTHRMLGFIPISTDTTAFVSANSGTVVEQQRSVLANVVDFLSPGL